VEGVLRLLQVEEAEELEQPGPWEELPGP